MKHLPSHQSNIIISNYEAVKLRYMLFDYLILHEFLHEVVKCYSKEFWAELAKHLPYLKKLDELMLGMKK